jgi:hypothetical protein
MDKKLPPRPYDFESGSQPCQAFQAQNDGYGENHHECFGPYNGQGRIKGSPQCHAWVSFCENCTRDHHEGGWERCPSPEFERHPPRGALR